jgi:hypothetical protein
MIVASFGQMESISGHDHDSGLIAASAAAISGP